MVGMAEPFQEFWWGRKSSGVGYGGRAQPMKNITCERIQNITY